MPLLNESHCQDFTYLLFVLTEFPQGYPKIIVNPELKSVEKEKPAMMQCQAEANGRSFEIEWFKNNVPVELGDNRRLTITDTGICLAKSGRVLKELNINIYTRFPRRVPLLIMITYITWSYINSFTLVKV